MKKIGLGIAILLFAIVITLCSSGMELLSIGIGIVGLIFSIIGFMERIGDRLVTEKDSTAWVCYLRD